jgi:hypothetical protein
VDGWVDRLVDVDVHHSCLFPAPPLAPPPGPPQVALEGALCFVGLAPGTLVLGVAQAVLPALLTDLLGWCMVGWIVGNGVTYRLTSALGCGWLGLLMPQAAAWVSGDIEPVAPAPVRAHCWSPTHMVSLVRRATLWALGQRTINPGCCCQRGHHMLGPADTVSPAALLPCNLSTGFVLVCSGCPVPPHVQAL